MSAFQRMFERLLTSDPAAVERMPRGVARDLPTNVAKIVGAMTLQQIGDQVVKASTVLPWVFHSIGVPVALVGLLVPIREAGSMLPQALISPLVLRVHQRKWVCVVGSLVQAVMAAAMAVIAAIGQGLLAGTLILLALAVFSLGRSLSSIASKDVLGRTVPAGSRGQINGFSVAAAGVVAITLGLALRAFGDSNLSPGLLAALLAGGGVMWLLTALVYARVREPDGEDSAASSAPEGELRHAGVGDRAATGWFTTAAELLRDDVPFRRFVVARSLLLVSALSPPFVISMAASSGSSAVGGLGGFIVASGLAALIGGTVFGRIADRSSRRLMAVGAGLASAVLVVLVIVTRLPGFDGGQLWGAVVLIASYFLLTLLHTGVRVGRKTYVVDMAEGDQRTKYVAVSNSAMGMILLVAGGLSSLLSLWGVEWALLFLSGLGLLGVFVTARLPDVSVR
jgi:MFS family permease